MDIQAQVGSELVTPGDFSLIGGGISLVDGFPVSDGSGRHFATQAISGVSSGDICRLDVEIGSGYALVRFGNHGITAGSGLHTVETEVGSNLNLVCEFEEQAGAIVNISLRKLTPIE